MAIRVYTLAKEFGVTSKAILDKCKAEGLDVKNHMSVLSAGLAATIREWFSEGEHKTTEETTERVNLIKVKKKVRRKKKKAVPKKEEEAEEKPPVEETEVAEKPAPAEPAKKKVKKKAKKVKKEEPQVVPAEKEEAEEEKLKPAAKVILPETKAEEDKPPVEEKKEPPKPAGPVNVPAPAVLKGPQVIRVDKPEPVRPPRPQRRRPPAPAPAAVDDIPPLPVPGKPTRRGKPSVKDDDTEAKRKAKSRVHPRRGLASDAVAKLKEWRDRDLQEREQRLAMASGHPQRMPRVETKKRVKPKSVAVPKGKIQIGEPILLKEFCSATGTPFSKLFPKLMEHGIPATINQVITAEQAELLAIELGVEIEIVKQKSTYDEILEQFQNRKDEHLEPRSPVVTFLGHVDHGKTSLLDKIRNSRVTEGEAGGITQHIGACKVAVDDHHVVFLDTPGHEAFTSLRARGAQMTDIVVLVIAADDGIMPQTVEAISHAKAAGVPIVVALNKIDLPNVDENKILGQLAEKDLVPTQWGGEVDVIKTSAITGEGIDDLLEHLSTLSELLDFKADAKGPAAGIVIEARHNSLRGTIADLLVQQGVLKQGNILVAGKSFGRVRAMHDDSGKKLKKAGPSTPVEILGLNEVPEAGEKFYVVENMQQAQAIAEEKKTETRDAYLNKRTKVTLENIFEQVEAGETHHLNLIVKADAQGSLDALNKKLNEIGTDEVQVRILHTGIGGITEGDVILADASKAIIIGFGVVADDIAKLKAQKQNMNVEIRTYTVIYHLLEEITAALEGLLTPTYKQKTTGRATVREVFRISHVGAVAGCMVSDGFILRSSKVRIIRQNVIIREEGDIDTLKRFKDDAKEVKQGYECGIKIKNFDDIKEGDIIEAYQVETIERKIQPAGSES